MNDEHPPRNEGIPATPHDLRLALRSKKRWWQSWRLEEMRNGRNVRLRPNLFLRFVLALLFVPRRCAILSVMDKLPREPYAVLIEGWRAPCIRFKELDDALEVLVSLI